jgi:hypothetical protein
MTNRFNVRAGGRDAFVTFARTPAGVAVTGIEAHADSAVRLPANVFSDERKLKKAAARAIRAAVRETTDATA